MLYSVFCIVSKNQSTFPSLTYILFYIQQTQLKGSAFFAPKFQASWNFYSHIPLSFVACNVSDELRIWVSVSVGISIPILPYLICCLFLIFLVSCRHYLIYHYQAFFTIWIQSISAFFYLLLQISPQISILLLTRYVSPSPFYL